MNFQSLWYKTKLPDYVVDGFIEESKTYGVETATIKDNVLNLETRNSKTCWISQSHWIAGFCHHYVQLANQYNYGYELVKTPDRPLQYTVYDEGEHYNGHVDTIDEVQSGLIRKLSFTIQLSSPEEYSGGELQFLDDGNHTFFAPKEKGTIIIFDSRMRHRVRKVKSGTRKSIVGWVEGPRWK